MTKNEKIEFDGFMKAKRQIAALIEGRIEVLEQQRGDMEFIHKRESKIWELEELRSHIRNVVLYKVESKFK
jgi:hypothetical protein